MYLNSLPSNTVTNREILAQKFVAKYFPSTKSTNLRDDITTFTQYESESLYDTWERYKDLLKRFFHHELSIWL